MITLTMFYQQAKLNSGLYHPGAWEEPIVRPVAEGRFET